jgi:predicted transcriptional regulator
MTGTNTTTIGELESYMDMREELYFTLYPEPKSGPRLNWSGYRNYIARVRNGLVVNTTLETSTQRASDHLLGLRRLFGEEIHPRKRIHKRQAATLAAFTAMLPAESSVEEAARLDAEAAVAAGRVVSHEKVVGWPNSWGKPNELPCPTPEPHDPGIDRGEALNELARLGQEIGVGYEK